MIDIEAKPRQYGRFFWKTGLDLWLTLDSIRQRAQHMMPLTGIDLEIMELCLRNHPSENKRKLLQDKELGNVYVEVESNGNRHMLFRVVGDMYPHPFSIHTIAGYRPLKVKIENRLKMLADLGEMPYQILF